LTSWGGVFYHPTFVDSGARALSLEGCTRYICENDEPRGISNIIYRERASVRIASLPLLFQYFGPLLYQGADGHVDCVAITDALSSQFDYVHYSFPPAFGDSSSRKILEALQGGWRIIERETIVVDSQGLSEWGRSFRDDVRNKINKARRAHVRIRKADELPGQLWELSYKRKSLATPVGIQSLEQWSRALIDSSLLRIYVAELDGKPVAFRGELVFGEFAYDWIAGSNPIYHPTGVNQFLMAEIGDDLSRLNLRAWDLVGGGIESIADFKKSFGATKMAHWHLRRSFTLKGRAYALLKNLRHGAA
jgi:hypothetical protein